MFYFLEFIIVVTLSTFGAVLSHDSLAITMAWVLAIAIMAVSTAIQYKKVDYLLVAAFIAVCLTSWRLGTTPGLWFVTCLWAWRASQRGLSRVVAFLRVVLLFGLFEGCLGLFQYFAAPGWILGYQNWTASVVSGTLINKNHFAGLMELLIPSAIGLAFIAARRHNDVSRAYLHLLAGALMALSLAFSLSRMGIFSFIVAMMFISAVLMLRKSTRSISLTLTIGLLGLVTAGVLWIGIDVIVARYGELMTANALVEADRHLVFRDTLRLTRAFPFGVGIGRYRDAFRRFQTYHPEVFYDHAHNDYLETAAEWGIPVALCFWICVLSVFMKLVRRLVLTKSDEEQGVLLVCVAAMCAILIHSLADFNLQIPSNAILFFSFLGVGLGILYPARPTSSVAVVR